MTNIEFHSHEQQDEFIYNLFGAKEQGFFLDISCGHPYIGSNSYTLEKYCNWQGIGFDLRDCEKELQWSNYRNSQFHQLDATSQSLTDFLSTNVAGKITVDYISLDVDAAGTNLALQTLHRVLDSSVKFKAMTFEHECYYHGPSIRDDVRNLLQELGYIPLFKDVRLLDINPSPRTDLNFEDWWIDPNSFESSILDASSENLYYSECIEQIKKVSKLNYNAVHACSRAWPNEYRLFWNTQEEYQLKELFNTSNN